MPNDKPIDLKGVPFNGEDSFGKVLTIEIPDMKSFDDIGIIVRLNDWAAKDIEAVDPYVRATTVNGQRGVAVNLAGL